MSTDLTATNFKVLYKPVGKKKKKKKKETDQLVFLVLTSPDFCKCFFIREFEKYPARCLSCKLL